MNKNLLSKNISSNVQENTPNGVVSSSSLLYNIEQNIYKVFVRPTYKSNETKRSYVSGFVKVTLLFFLLTFFTSKVDAQCTHTIQLTDTYGDGWNGGRVAVSVNGVAVLTNLGSTFTTGLGPISFTFTATAGQTIRVYRTTAGSFPSEMRIRVNNPAGTAVINTIQPVTGTATTGGSTGTASCAAAYNPCTTIPTLTCGAAATSYSMAGAAGAWNTYGGVYGVPGQEKLFQFTPTVTGSYAVTMSASAGYNDFFWKAASVGCNATSWTYVNDILGTETWNVTLTAGVAYYFMMDDEDQVANTGSISVACPSAPSYDPCASIPTISGCGTSATASMTGSGAGWSVTSCGFATPGQERLFSFTAPTTGTYTLNLTAITGGFVDFFWKAASGGCNAAGWNCIDDISAAGTYNAITPMSFTAGTTYYILLDPEVTGTYSATFSLVCPVPPPANDLCSGAINLPCGTSALAGTTEASVAETAPGLCVGTNGVWYSFAGDGLQTTISAFSSMDIGVYIASGTCASRTQLQCIDGFFGNSTETSTQFLTSVGTTYYVYIANYTGSTTGTFTISRSCVSPCTGTPNPGATTATSSQVFAGGSTTLGITTAQTGAGISYQWQSGPSASGPWNPIGGANSSTYLASPTTATYYQCVVTCSNGGASGTSTPILISVNPYCEPVYTVGKTDGDLISNISISGTTLSNNSGTAQANPSYTFFTGQPNYTANLVAANSYNVTVTVGTWGTQGIAAWIDYNDNNIFEASEKIGNTAGTIGTGTGSTPIPANHTATFTINLSCNPALGTHRMRVRDVFNVAGPLIDPCATYSFGETEDYLVTIVSGAPFTPTFSSTPTTPNCVGTPVTYTATAGQTNYVWTFPGTAGVDYTLVSGGTSTSNTAVVVYNNTGSQTISMDYASPLGCASAGAVTNTITITATPTTANAGSNQTSSATCGLTTVTLAGNTPVVGTGTWSVVSGTGGSFFSATNPTTNFSGIAGETYVLRWTISNSPCTASTSDVTITFNQNPTATAGGSQTICETGTATVSGATSSNGTILWTSNGAGSLTNETTLTPTYTAAAGDAGTTVTLTMTVSNSPCTAATATYSVVVNPTPIATAGGTQTICQTETATVSGASSSNGTILWTSNGAGSLTNETTLTPTYTAAAGDAGTTVTLTMTVFNSPCTAATATYSVVVNASPTIANAGSNQTSSATCGLTTVTLAGNTPVVGTGTWSVVSGNGGSFVSANNPTTNFSGIAGETYVLRWTISNSPCTASTSDVTITFNPTPEITCPSTITIVAGTGSCSAVATYAATSTTPGTTITYSIPSGSTFNVGTTVVTATATTVEGCVSTCTFNVTVTSSGSSNWLGSISNDWFDSGNWCGGIPTATSDVEISTGAPFMPIISTTGAIAKNITINSGASLTMNGTGYLTIVGNWTNNGTFTATSGDVNFNGSSSQTLTGATTFFNLDLNNSAGLTINSNVNVNGLCQLVSGILTTGSNVLQISNGGYLSSTTGYVNGYLKKYIDLGDFYESFEVGSSTAYTPANFNFNNVLSAGYLTVNTISSDHPSISSSALDGTKTVNRYWNLVGSGLTFDFYDVDLTYAVADKDAGFIDMYAGAKIYSGSTWNVTTPNSGTANSLSIGAVNTLGSIQIGIFNPTPVAISLSPNYGYIGLTSNIVFNGIGFVSGATSVNPVAGVTINSTTVNNDSTMTVNISVSPSAITGLRKFAITNITNATGFGGTSDSLDFTISAHPVAAFYSNRSFVKCNVSGNVEFLNNSTGGTSYFWDFGAGANPATATGNGPYTVTYSTTGLKTVKLIAYSPLGNDTLIRVNYIAVTSAAPFIPSSISGPLNITCSNSTVTHVYSAPLLNDVSYNWTVPAGATITSGLGTSAIVVAFSGTFTSGTISLSESNGCGTSATRSIVVSKAPSTPGVISGSTVVCGLASATYSIAAVPGATSYTWIVPSGASITSGSGTSAIVVTFSGNFTSGTISVTANTACASSAARTLPISNAPSTPGVISGTTVVCGLSSTTYSIAAVSGATSYTWTLPTGVTSTLALPLPITTTGTSLTVTILTTFTSGTISVTANNACASSAAKTLPISNAPPTPGVISGYTFVCGLSSTTYSIAAVSGATSYTWTLPTGVTSSLGTSPITTSLPSLYVFFAATPISGTISVKANTICLSSAGRTLAISNAPSTPGVISGTTVLCNLSSATYSIAAVSGATSYTWTLPAGVTSTLALPLPITTTGTSLTVNISPTFTSGAISVTANTTCASSVARTLPISKAPSTPGVISGSTVVCGLSSATYSIAAVPGATSYTWIVPSGASITSGSGTSAIVVDFSGTFTSGTISVTANNACSSSAARTLPISNIPAVPASISGPKVVCGIISATYTVAASPGATSYIWTLPTGVTSTLPLPLPITTTGTSLTVDISSIFASGSITVKASNSCATSLARSLSISTAPPIPGLITGPTNICALATATYSIAAVTGATGYTWSLPTGVTSTTGASTITTTATSITVLISSNIATGPISVVANNSCGSGATRSKSLTGCRSNNSDVQADSVNEKTIEVTVYPNPTSDNVNIEFTSDIESNLLFELYDIQGKIILSKVEIITEGQNLLFYNVEELDKGIYFIKLTDEQSKMLITKKLVVQ